MDGSANKKSIIVAGFPYAFPYYGRVFDFFKRKQDIILILPTLWLAKNGKIRIPFREREDIFSESTTTWSYGGSGMGGLFKGWMPWLPLRLVHHKLKHQSHILYNCSELYLLSTLWNSAFARLLGYRIVLFTWQNIPNVKRLKGLKLYFSNIIVRLNLLLVHGIICGNKGAKDIVDLSYLQRKTIICPISGVDVEKFSPGNSLPGRERLSLKNNERIILFYGVLDERKGVEYLLEAFSKIKERVDIKLVIVGTGPLREKHIILAKDLNIIDQVIFIDWLPNQELPSLLRAAEVFVYPSISRKGWEEQFGYAMAEASACEVPVVATNTGSINEVVKDKETGILIEPQNVNELRDALEKILKDKKLSREYGQSGRRYIIEHFSHKIVADKLENFLNEF